MDRESIEGVSPRFLCYGAINFLCTAISDRSLIGRLVVLSADVRAVWSLSGMTSSRGWVGVFVIFGHFFSLYSPRHLTGWTSGRGGGVSDGEISLLRFVCEREFFSISRESQPRYLVEKIFQRRRQGCVQQERRKCV